MNDWNNNGHYDSQDMFLDFSAFEYSGSGGTTGNSNKRPEVAPEDAANTLGGSIIILIIIGIAFLLCFACGKDNGINQGCNYAWICCNLCSDIQKNSN